MIDQRKKSKVIAKACAGVINDLKLNKLFAYYIGTTRNRDKLKIIEANALKYGINPGLIRMIIDKESKLKP